MNNISIHGVYKSSNIQATTKDWEHIFLQTQGDVIVCGVLNCHHSRWGSTLDNTQGNRLIDAIDETNLIILNDCNPTTVGRPNDRPSPIDLTLVLPSLMSYSEWNIVDDTLASDHFPIHISILVFLNETHGL